MTAKHNGWSRSRLQWSCRRPLVAAVACRRAWPHVGEVVFGGLARCAVRLAQPDRTLQRHFTLARFRQLALLGGQSPIDAPHPSRNAGHGRVSDARSRTVAGRNLGGDHGCHRGGRRVDHVRDPDRAERRVHPPADSHPADRRRSRTSQSKQPQVQSMMSTSYRSRWVVDAG